MPNLLITFINYFYTMGPALAVLFCFIMTGQLLLLVSIIYNIIYNISTYINTLRYTCKLRNKNNNAARN